MPQLTLRFGENDRTNREPTLSEPPNRSGEKTLADIDRIADSLRPQMLEYIGQAGGEVDLHELRSALGHPGEYMDQDPQANPVNRLVKEMRDAGELVVQECDRGEPLVSLPKQEETLAASVSPELGSWQRDVEQRFDNHFVQPAIATLTKAPWSTAEDVANLAFGRMRISNPTRTAADILHDQVKAGGVQIAWDREGMPHYALDGVAVPDHLATQSQIDEFGGTFPGTPPLVRPDRQQTFGGEPVEDWPKPKHYDDAITVDRPHDGIDGPAHRFVIRCEDHVEILISPENSRVGTVLEIDHIRRRVLVKFYVDDWEEEWFAADKVFPTVDRPPEPRRNSSNHATRPTSAEPPAAEVGRVDPARDLQAEGGQETADQQRPYTFDDYRKYRERFAAGIVTADELKTEFRRLFDGRDDFIGALKKRYDATQLKGLAARFGCFDAKRNNKQQNAEHVWRALLQSFSLSGSVQYNPLGGQTFEQALAEQIETITDEQIRQHVAAEQKHAADEKQAMENPQTLEQFQLFIRRRGLEELSVEQRFRFEKLHADKTRAERAARRKTTVEQIASDGAASLEITIKEGFHDRQQIPLWICQLSERVDRSTYNELKIKAKQLGGWFSSFKKADAGFQFTSQESAEKFQQLLAGNVDRSDELAARAQRKMESASERLLCVAETLEAEADEVLATDETPLKNTVRRSEMAAGMRGRAYASQAMAGTLRSIAQALASTEAQYLDGVRARTHVDTLTGLLRRGKTNRNQILLREKGELGVWDRHREVENLDNRPVEDEDTLHVGYPYPSIYKRHLEEAIVVAENRKGTKQRARKLRSWLIGDGYFAEFTDEFDIRLLTEFIDRCRAVGIETRWIESGMEDYKRLHAANVHTPQELRCALRELIPHLKKRKGDDPVAKLEQQLIGTKIPGFFPTPKPIISRMLELADIQPGDRVLEPSAGKGDILDMLRSQRPDAELTAVEINRTLLEVIEAKGHDASQQDFLEYQGQHDVVVMNPPFEDALEIDHVRHAFDQLAAGGRLVSVMSAGPFFRSDKKAEEFRAWLEEVGAETEDLPEDAFKGVDAFRQTGVRTRIVSISLPS